MESVKTSDFDYFLPKELIAQEPLKQRDSSRLFCLSRESGEISHHVFNELPVLLKRGDRLVFNNTRVLPARFLCRKETGGRVEVLFLHKIDERTWDALVKPSARLKSGAVVSFLDDGSGAFRLDRTPEPGVWRVSLAEGMPGAIEPVIYQYGRMPLPPYIRRNPRDDDAQTYQTVYAREHGAVAAPTAGLHFTQSLLETLKSAGVDSSFVTLHVGVGTFKPVTEDDPAQHGMHAESYALSEGTVCEIADTKKNGGRIIAVGTTTVRVLEHCAGPEGKLEPGAGTTRLMIMPGHVFRVVDGLITNFHLPRSTLLMLVSAFAGRERILDAYAEAQKMQYRFYSYGDAMFIQ